MTELTDLSPTDASNTSITGQSLEGNVANMANMDTTLQAILGMLGRWTSSDTIASAATTDIGAQAEAYLTVSGTTTITAFGTVRTGTIRFLRFSGALTLTHNATSLILPGAANITTVAGDTAVFVSEGSGNWRCVSYQRAGSAPPTVPKGHIYGLTLSNNTTDATNDIDIAVGEAASEGGIPVLISLASGITKRLDGSWAVGSGNGGLDVGTVANGVYHVYLIRRPDTGVVDACFSLSASAPDTANFVSAAYTQYRRIGSILRTGGVIVPFSQEGNEFLRKTSVLDVSATNPGTSAVTRTLSVPTGIVVWAMFNAIARNTANGVSFDHYFSALVQTDEPTGQTVAPLSQTGGVYNIGGGSALASSGSMTIRTNTSAQIRSRAVGSDASCTLYIATYGWIDKRGSE